MKMQYLTQGKTSLALFWRISFASPSFTGLFIESLLIAFGTYSVRFHARLCAFWGPSQPGDWNVLMSGTFAASRGPVLERSMRGPRDVGGNSATLARGCRITLTCFAKHSA